jgi:hypothetical protein
MWRRPRFWLVVWLLAALVWVAVVSQASLRTWPQIPLDLSREDPQLKAAYSAAVFRHVARSALTALAPPLLVLVCGFAVYRFARRQEG